MIGFPDSKPFSASVSTSDGSECEKAAIGHEKGSTARIRSVTIALVVEWSGAARPG